MPTTLLDLPVEIRLNIYNHLFSTTIALVEAGIQEQCPSLLPVKATIQPLGSCHGQVLRVCRTINREAEPILYARTQFCTLTQAFAGMLPTTLTKGAHFARKVKNLTWQLNCDLMKHFYPEDFTMTSQDIAEVSTLELRCQAENWKESFCGEWIDRDAFVRGRNQMVCYAQNLQTLMNESGENRVLLIEDRSGLSRGRVVLRLTREKSLLSGDEMLIE